MRVTEKQESKGKYRERQKGPREQRVSGFMERKRNWERLRMRGGGGGGGRGGGRGGRGGGGGGKESLSLF